LNVHEYQAQNLMRSFGIKVPRGAVASTPEEAAKIAADIGKLQRLFSFYWLEILLVNYSCGRFSYLFINNTSQ
jgi:hypothetical protein